VSDVPVTDFEKIARWEWFRRADWGEDSSRGGLCKAFSQLVEETSAKVCLEADCGFAANSLLLHKLGVRNILCCDESEFITGRARENIDSHGLNLPVFTSAAENISENAAHKFDAVFCPSLMLEPQWENLLAKFKGVCKALNAGGFLAFTGPAQGRDWHSLLEDYRRHPQEQAVWTYREGDIACTKVIVRGAEADNFADERILHVITEAGVARIEATSRRLPAYWSWNIVSDLARQAGFCHVEQRSFSREGEGAVRLIVAWKEGSLSDTAYNEPANYSTL